MSQQRHLEEEKSLPGGPISVVTDSDSGLREVVCLLAREGVGLARRLRVDAPPPGQPGTASTLERALQSVQADAGTEIIVLVADALLSEATDRLLEQVRRSDKPTVACFLGSDPRLAWRAGAIPATRLDEAVMRAAAWVRGWDQALVSSQLEEQHDQLSALAGELRARIGPARRQLCGLFPADMLRREALLVLAQALGHEVPPDWLRTVSRVSDMGPRLREALAERATAVVFLSLALSAETRSDATEGVLSALRKHKKNRPVCIAHVFSEVCEPARLAEIEAALGEAGAVVAPSNAAAALLAGLLLQPLAGGA
jgi:FdrA protein